MHGPHRWLDRAARSAPALECGTIENVLGLDEELADGGVGNVEVKVSQSAKAWNQLDEYWPCVVYNCASAVRRRGRA